MDLLFVSLAFCQRKSSWSLYKISKLWKKGVKTLNTFGIGTSGNVLYKMVVSIEIDFPKISLAEIFCFTLFDKVKLGKFARSTSIL